MKLEPYVTEITRILPSHASQVSPPPHAHTAHAHTAHAHAHAHTDARTHLADAMSWRRWGR